VKQASPAIAIALVAAVCGAATAEPAERRALSQVRTIAIDPGHGGDNTGCMGYHGVFEKHLTLEIAGRIELALLERTDARVVLTRTDDIAIGLRERAHLSNANRADIFLSIHLNSAPRAEAEGVETFFLSAEAADEEIRALVEREQQGQPPEPPIGATAEAVQGEITDTILADIDRYAVHGLAETLATVVQRHLVRALGAQSRGVKQAPFGVLRESHCPAVVIELGFLTHRREGQNLLLADYQDKIADAIVQAVIAYDRLLNTGAPREATSAPPTEASGQ
jgi:N-acetylmuramoyl-L-alanine amidase